MQLELKQHLWHAVEDGKSDDAVVGPIALAFAETRARELPGRGDEPGVRPVDTRLITRLPKIHSRRP